MTRQGAWGRVISNIWKYLKKDWSEKNYVGEDAAGHKFYEITNSRRNILRGFDPPLATPNSQPDLEWQSWLRGTRRFPPSDSEIAQNRLKQQAQVPEDLGIAHRAPHVQSNINNTQPARYPQYNDMETSPGAKNSD
uniref:NADH dehydrogenase [ubiquinone] 1 alpha subcomplex subunit 12 n=1 Tax=Heterorhabditis bacteriophora TaxID=37862 RepID=A0A1I7X770_HETBA